MGKNIGGLTINLPGNDLTLQAPNTMKRNWPLYIQMANPQDCIHLMENHNQGSWI